MNGPRRWRRAVLLGGLAVVAALGVEAWRFWTPAPAVRERAAVVVIPAQDGLLDIARRLSREALIGSPEGFVALSLLRGTARSLKAGEYEIPAGASTPQVLTLIEAGRVRLHPVLHPEGASVVELARALEAAGLAAAAEVERVARDPAFLRSLGIDAPGVEGYLFPDTYHVARGVTVEQILTRMVERLFAKVGPDLRARARERNLTLHELLTLASIIEREAVVAEERRLISAVFWNRLRLGMPLQADPTVQYAVGKERQSLSRRDLQSDHVYNTYRHPGLPPGPIASPGLPAIEAALDPAPVRYLYFVSIDHERHYFSTTIEEHDAAVARYRLARPR